MPNKSKYGVGAGGICDPNKIGGRPNEQYHTYKTWKYKRREGHIGPDCWRKTRKTADTNTVGPRTVVKKL
eukprot:56120-Heterocapsa_arctica.AAC.1